MTSNDEYNMNHKERGVALIINIENVPRMHPRLGSKQDVANLRATLKKSLEFKKVKYNEKDLKAQDIKNAIKTLSCEVDHTDYDCFLLVLMSHGSEDFILGADGEKVLIKDVQEIINKSPSLKLKPKLIFIQACRGQKSFEIIDCPIKIESTTTSLSQHDSTFDENVDSKFSSLVSSQTLKIPVEQDFLIHYSTTADYFSYRFTDGSVFINAMCQVFDEYASKEISLIQLLTKVNDKVSKFEFESGDKLLKQVSSFESRLVKDVYFRSKTIKLKPFFSNEDDLNNTTTSQLFQINHNLMIKKENFIGRKDILRIIDQSFDDNCRGVVLTAFGGSGKTTLANEYGLNLIRTTNNERIIVRWFESETKEKLERDYRNFSEILSSNFMQLSLKSLIDKTNSLLSSAKSQKFLLIFDNVECFEDIEDYISCLPKSRVKIIITTRNNQLIPDSDFQIDFKILFIDSFTDSETQEYIEKNLKRKVINEEQNKRLNELVRNGFNEKVLPLKLSLTIKFLNANSLQNLNNLLDKIERDKTAMKQVEDYLFDDLNSKAPNALKLLSYCSMFDPDMISFNLLNTIINELQIDNDDNESLNKLTTLGMVEINNRKEIITMHRLIQQEMISFRQRNSHLFESESDILVNIIHILIKADGDEEDTWIKLVNNYVSMEFDIIQANMILNYIKEKNLKELQVPKVQESITKLKMNMGRFYLTYTDNFKATLKFSLDGLKYYYKLYPKDQLNSDKATCLTNVGLAYLKDLKHTKALRFLNDGFIMRLKLYGDIDHPLIAESLYYIGLIYFRKGIWPSNQSLSKLSLEYNMKSLNMRQRLLQKEVNYINQLNLAYSFKNVALSYFQLNEYQTCIENLLKANEIMSKICKNYPNHSLAVFLLTTISDCYMIMKDDVKYNHYNDIHTQAFSKLAKTKEALCDSLSTSSGNTIGLHYCGVIKSTYY